MCVQGIVAGVNDLLGGSIDMMLTSATFSIPHIKGGKVRAVGIAGTQRTASLPEVPTFAEQGYPNYQVVDWKAIAGPKGMPADVVAYLNKEPNEVLKQKSVEREVDAEGTLGGATSEQMMRSALDIERGRKWPRKQRENRRTVAE